MKNNQKIATYGIFIGIIIVLQLMGSLLLKLFAFNLSLVLIPIVLGSYLYGVGAGALFGAVFGIIAYICCITNLDAGGYMLFLASPLLTGLLCLLKGTAAGVAAALIAKLFKSQKNFQQSRIKQLVAIFAAAIAAPVVNTGIFIAAMFTVFPQQLSIWAGGGDVVKYVISSIVLTNFVLELILNIVFAPSLLTVAKATKKLR